VDGNDQVEIVEGDYDRATLACDESTERGLPPGSKSFPKQFSTTDSASTAVPLTQRNPFLAFLVNLTRP